MEDGAAKIARDKFDLHAHGIGAAKDAYDALMKAHKGLQDKFDELKDNMGGEELEAEEEGGEGADADEDGDADDSKMAGDKKGYTKDGKPSLRLRLKRALDALKLARAASTQEALETMAAERIKVIGR